MKDNKFWKTYPKLTEVRLLKPYLEICSALSLTQLINKPTRSALKTSFIFDHILTNSKESATQQGVTTLGLPDHDIIFCTRKTKCFKSRKHNATSVRTYKNYSQKLLEERLTKMKILNYLLISCTDSVYNRLSKILQDIINDIAPLKDIPIKGNTKPWFDSNMIGLIRKRDKLKKRFNIRNCMLITNTFRNNRIMFKGRSNKRKQTMLRNNPKELWKALKNLDMPCQVSHQAKIWLRENNCYSSMKRKMPIPSKISTET